MKTYLIWDHEDEQLYESTSEEQDSEDAIHKFAERLYGDCYESRDFCLSVSVNNGETWYCYNFELCMSPSIHITSRKKSDDPRPKPKKL